MPAARRVAQEMNMVAYTLRRIAIVAHAVGLARCADVKTCRVYRSCRRAGTGQSRVDGLCYLIKSDDKDDMARAESNGCHTVAVTVDIDNHAVLCDGVGTRKIIVGTERLQIYLDSLGTVDARSRSNNIYRPSSCSARVSPISRRVIEPPHDTVLPCGISSITLAMAPADVGQ